MREATSQNLVQATVIGAGLTKINVTLKAIGTAPLEVTIPVGTIFKPQSTQTQNMVVVQTTVVKVGPVSSIVSVSVPVACGSMELDQPDANDTFLLEITQAQGDLAKLLDLADFSNETFRVKQFAIWTITDNPDRNDFMGIAIGFSVFGTGPTDAEMQSIRTLFGKAGISTSSYKAFG